MRNKTACAPRQPTRPGGMFKHVHRVATHVRGALDCTHGARGSARRVLVAKGTGGDGKGLERPDVAKLADLARIQVSEDEVSEWGQKIESIVDWFGELQKVNVEGVPAAVRAYESDSNLREDEAKDYADKLEMMREVPERDGNYVRVPKIGQ